jgi:hypothetical protein
VVWVLQTISQVLTDCGSDIDAAIKRLGQLQLRAEGKSEAQHSASAPATPSSVSPRDGVVPGARQNNYHLGQMSS